jgi:hypothetical protein
MKNLFKNAFAVLATAFLFAACNNDDSIINSITGTGNLAVEFDNAYGANDLVLNAANVTSNNEILKISTVRYFISNIVLYDQYGTAYTYPKSDSYFIVDEADEDSHVLQLANVPAGNYTRIKFGIGVDEQQWEAGEANQGNLYTNAQLSGMISDWDSGYWFLNFEGTFTSPTIPADTAFLARIAKTATNYNYKEFTLDLPTQALVRTTITPEIHVVADLSKIIDGANKFKFSDDATITDEPAIPLVAANIASMFTVAHVHND